MSEEHFDLLASRLSFGIEVRGGALAGEVSDALVFLAVDGSGFRVGATLRFQEAISAVCAPGPVFARAPARRVSFWIGVGVNSP